jgi:HSP20 family molecular chaperone IbpA
MTTMTRFVPFRSPLDGVAVLQNRLNSIFNDFASSPGELQNESLSAGNFIPPVDIYEDANRLVLKLEVPGIPQGDLQINLENQTLTVKGERKLMKRKRTSTGLSAAMAVLFGASRCPPPSRRIPLRRTTRTAFSRSRCRRRKPPSRSS